MLKNKVSIILVILSIFSSTTFCQSIFNRSFEEWFVDGLNQHPVGWTSSNDFSLPIGFQGVMIDSTSHDGLYAAKIITTNIGFAAAPYAGFIVNGSMNVRGHYDIDSIHQAGEPFNGRPSALSGYYKYQSDAFIEDWGHAFVLLKKYDSVNQRVDTVGYGSNVLLNPSEEYKPFKVDIEYYQDVEPDSIVIAFFSTYPNHPISGGKLWIDDISLDYTTHASSSSILTTLKVFPNPVSSVLSIQGENINQVKLFNSSGSNLITTGQINKIDLSGFPTGIYYLAVEIKGSWEYKKIIKR